MAVTKQQLQAQAWVNNDNLEVDVIDYSPGQQIVQTSLGERMSIQDFESKYKPVGNGANPFVNIDPTAFMIHDLKQQVQKAPAELIDTVVNAESDAILDDDLQLLAKLSQAKHSVQPQSQFDQQAAATRHISVQSYKEVAVDEPTSKDIAFVLDVIDRLSSKNKDGVKHAITVELQLPVDIYVLATTAESLGIDDPNVIIDALIHRLSTQSDITKLLVKSFRLALNVADEPRQAQSSDETQLTDDN